MGLLDSLKYALGSATKNTANMGRAGRNNTTWGSLGGALVGAAVGSIAFPVGTILGFVVGGVIGSTFNYARS